MNTIKIRRSYILICTCYLELLILVKRSTCFGRSFRPPPAAQNCVDSKVYVEQLLLPTAIGDKLFDIYRCCIRSFELLVMDEKTVRNMYSVLQE